MQYNFYQLVCRGALILTCLLVVLTIALAMKINPLINSVMVVSYFTGECDHKVYTIVA